jgi:hypothetical protein
MTLRPSHRLPRLMTVAALLTLPLMSTLTGCVTVHGERALIPSGTKSDATRALARYTAAYNKAAKTFDAQAIATVESGPLGATDEATLRAYRATRTGDNPNYQPATLTDPKFYIPRQVGWPKWFVVVATYNDNTRNRWVMVFQRAGSQEAWRASYMASVPKSSVPRFATDGEGYAEPVAANASDLLVSPGALSKAYTDYLEKGDEGSDAFADGFATSDLRESRAQAAVTADYRVQYADQPAPADEFAPVALRTKDGGAFVFFATHHVERYVYRADLTPEVPPTTRALMTGTPKHTLTLGQVGRAAVTVPPKSKVGGKVQFLNLIINLVTAKGE